jgi:WD40 repeat protein
VDPLPTEILGLLDDCARMIRVFYPSISVACLQVHHYIIPLLPLESRISQVYGMKFQPGIVVRTGREQSWSPCVCVLEGRSDICYSVAFSPGGDQLVSGSADRTVKLWNMQRGCLLRVMIGHSDCVLSVVYSPDGMLIASGSADGTVRLWDAATGLQVGLYAGHRNSVWCIAFALDGQCIASGDDQGRVHVWSTDAAHRIVKVFQALQAAESLAFISPDRVMVASQKSIQVFAVELNCCIEHYFHLGKLVAFTMSPDRKLAASSTVDGDLTVWDAEAWTRQWTTKYSLPVSIGSLSFSSDSTHLAVAVLGSSSCCEVWDVQTKERIRRFNHARKIYNVQFSPNGSLLASACRNDAIGLWDLSIAESPRKDPPIACLALSPLGTIFATRSADGTVEVRTVESNKLVWTWQVENQVGSSPGMVMSSDDKFLVLYGTADRSVHIFDLGSGQLYSKLESTIERGVALVSFGSDSRHIALTGNAAEIELWDLDGCTRVWNSGPGYGSVIPPQYRPPCSDDLVPPVTSWRLREDGWIWQLEGMDERRVCWLPQVYRPLKPKLNENTVISQDKIMLITESRRFVFLDLKKGLGSAHSDS